MRKTKRLIENINVKSEKPIEDIFKYWGIEIENKTWVSKYNDYVRYEYEPFCTDGFKLEYTLIGDKNHLDLVELGIKQYQKKIRHLDNCLKLPFYIP